MRAKLWITAICMLLLAAAPALLLAQDGGGGMPTYTAKKGAITEAINSKVGALFDLGGVTMLFPRGLPVGESRLVTLKNGKGRLPGKLIGKGWKPIGKVLDFNGAFNTSSKPIVLSMKASRDPAKGNRRLVVAMEVGTFCEGPNKAHKLKGGLCSGFELHDAEFDASAKLLVARLESTGGLRLQFGTVAADADADE